MTRRCWLLLIVVLQFACSHPATAQSDADRINELVNAYARQYNFNGTLLVVNKGQVVISKGYGMKSVKDSTYNDVNTIYQMGSVTKQFTAALILQLEEQKKLSVKDKLSKYFPELSWADSITIENLLTHTSGIFNYTNDGRFMNAEATKPATHEKIISLFKDKPLGFTSGSKYSYSNSGYMLLGYIIEKVTGKTYEQMMHERILTPLGMTHSGFDFTHLQSPDKATGYTTYKEQLKIPGAIVDSTASYAAGALYATVNDMWAWHKGLLNNATIKAASLERAYTPFLSNYGYGWEIDSIYGKRLVQHGGGIFGFNTLFTRIPADDCCVILLCNMNTGSLEKISRGILAILNNRSYDIPKEKIVLPVDPAVLQQYAGDYELAPGFILTIRVQNNALKVRATGQPEFDLYAESEKKFFLKVVEASAEFVRGTDGTVTGLIWDQGGKKEAKKIK
ncbi:serine hydrolase [Paraflavitalea pollutisoli]|uniref:serine hydrolase n=1 Tax=Paraflavitalea pollutisoli TaxID=3034143 RepID=UPI0023EC036F|nr:serine hydrolase [Paraflavitalea sp. H1-2-19X]